MNKKLCMIAGSIILPAVLTMANTDMSIRAFPHDDGCEPVPTAMLQPPLTNASPRDSSELDSFIRATMSAYYIPGVASWCFKKGQVIWNQPYGYAILEDSIAVTEATLFMLASVSKTITGTALMQIWERGLIGLDEDINNFLPFSVRNPNFPDSMITFRHLLTHTSGIKDNWDLIIYYPGDPPIPLGQYLFDYLVPGGANYDSSLNYDTWPPGSQRDYSNVGAALVGYLVEMIADSFPVYCRDSIFTPLNMFETAWFLADLDTSHIAMPYSWNGSSYTPRGYYGFCVYPSGQLRTSISQLSRFLIAFYQKGQIDGTRILDSTTVELMTTVQYPSFAPNQGIIWYKQNLYSERIIWGHTGSNPGVRTMMFYCPAETSAAIVLTNGDLNEGSSLILDALFDYAKETAVGVDDGKDAAMKRKNHTLAQNDPNPFSRDTRIRFSLPVSGRVSLKVYDVAGRKNAVLIDDNLPAGEHDVVFDAKNLPSGVYYYRLISGNTNLTRRCIHLH